VSKLVMTEAPLTHGAKFTRTYHGETFTMTVNVDKKGVMTFKVGAVAHPSLRAAAQACIGAAAAEKWRSLDGKQFWHVRRYAAPADAEPAKVAPKPTPAKKPAAKAPAAKAPAKAPAAKGRTAKAA